MTGVLNRKTCFYRLLNGCGFINTSRVTLTTGESNFDKGNLSFDINQGNINIGRPVETVYFLHFHR
jgi:hypothetical protein